MPECFEIQVDPHLIVSVTPDGHIKHAYVYVDFFHDWEELTERVKRSGYWKEKIQEKLTEYFQETKESALHD